MPDIVITDIKMPVMNGIELIRKTREDFPDIVFIVLSGYGEYEYTSRAMELGVRHYILKPCDEAKIVEVIGKVTEELKVREEKKRKEDDMRTQVKRLAPRARETAGSSGERSFFWRFIRKNGLTIWNSLW